MKEITYTKSIITKSIIGWGYDGIEEEVLGSFPTEPEEIALYRTKNNKKEFTKVRVIYTVTVEPL